jgi:hypothetical protein
MKPALHQVDSGIDVRRKLQAISNVIHTTDTMLDAEQEAMELAEARRYLVCRKVQINTSKTYPKSIRGRIRGAVAHSVSLPDEDQIIAIHIFNNIISRNESSIVIPCL